MATNVPVGQATIAGRTFQVFRQDSGCPAHPGMYCPSWEDIQLAADEDA